MRQRVKVMPSLVRWGCVCGNTRWKYWEVGSGEGERKARREEERRGSRGGTEAG